MNLYDRIYKNLKIKSLREGHIISVSQLSAPEITSVWGELVFMMYCGVCKGSSQREEMNHTDTSGVILKEEQFC